MDINASGLRIQIVDEKNRAMFGVGGADMAGFASRLLRAIGGVLKDMPNGVRIEGHTDSLRYNNGLAGYSNWELSTDRANAARRELIAGGLPEQRVSQVVGFADTIRLNPDNPNDPLNRRISITVLDQNTGATKGGLDRNNAPAGPGQSQAAPAPAAPQGSVAVPAGQPSASGRTPMLVLPSRPSLGPSAPPPSGSGNR
jgi:chemotaxis protein MotB